MADKKDWAQITDELPRQGWTVEPTTQGHCKATPPDRTKGIVHFSHSGDHHALLNTIRDLRRRGFVWPPPAKKDLAVERRLMYEGAPAAGLCPDCHQPYEGQSHTCLIAKMQTPPPPPPPETADERADRLYRELKDAKALAQLTADEERNCTARRDEAQAALDKAAAEARDAADALTAKKAEFDGAFASAA